MITSLKASVLAAPFLNRALSAPVQGHWKQDREKTVAAAEKEGELPALRTIGDLRG
jgi:hypothetical protein